MLLHLKTPIEIKQADGAIRIIRALDLRVGPVEALVLKAMFETEMPEIARALQAIDCCAGLPASTSESLDAEDFAAAFAEIQRLVSAFAQQWSR